MIDRPKEIDERPDGKKVRNLRIALCVFFVIITACISLPFVLAQSGTEYKGLTVITFFSKAFMSGNIAQGLLYLMFGIIPAAGFFIAVFDRKRMVKGIAGVLCSALGAAWVTFFVGPVNLLPGSLFSLLLYILTFILSVMLLLAKAAENQEKLQAKQKKKQEEEHIVIKMDKDGSAAAEKKSETK